LGAEEPTRDPHLVRGQCLDQLARTVHPREVLLQDLAEELLLPAIETRHLGIGEVLLAPPVLADHLPTAAAEALRELCLRERDAGLPAQALPALEVRGVGVHQHAVHVEDHGLDHARLRLGTETILFSSWHQAVRRPP
jgi:hypothetical protein